ncbi:cell division protein FtsZ [bacterium]|nr:cell division protein FtsZ [bacterium]
MRKNKPKIKVIGIGGSGSNTVSRMAECNIQGIELVAVNTDVQNLRSAKADIKIQIGKETTRGLGTGMNYRLGKIAAQESKEELSELVKDADMVFITCGLGGGTGTGASPIISELAKKAGALTIAVVTEPFSFEGIQRKKIAKKGLKQLREKVDTLLVIPNDKLLKIKDKNITLKEAFWLCDEVLREAVQGISELIVKRGIVNLDFADIRSVMEDSGPAIFGMGKATGSNRATTAALRAINSPLLDVSIKGAKNILFNVSASDLTLFEINTVAKIITQNAGQQAKIIFGATKDKNLKKGELKVTIIATGF